MKASDFKRLCELVKDADKKDPIWYAGYLLLDLTEKQVNKLVDVLQHNVSCINFTVGDSFFRRQKIKTPSGIEIFANSDNAMKHIKDIIECCTEERAKCLILDFYNAQFITCGEYNRLYDWITTHTDGNGCVSKTW